MPKSTATEPPPVASAGDLTLLLGKQRVHYYFGPNVVGQVPPLYVAATPQAVRKVLLTWSQRSKGFVHIKQDKSAGFEQMSAMLDEMSITGQQNYSLEALTAADQQLLAKASRP